MDRLESVIQPYDWGSRYVLAELQGRPTPSPGPEAELWVGAHPAAPALLEREEGLTTLHKVVGADPETELGQECAAQFEGRLPFLLKVLAVEKALSIQVHPTRDQARAGYEREEAAGLAMRDRTRCYKDDWSKPEVLMALTPFEALAGFRAPEDAARVLGLLDVPALAPVVGALRADGTPDPRTTALRRVLEWPTEERHQLLADVEWRCGELAEAPALPDDDRATFNACVRIGRQYPGDVGLVASLLLQHRSLEPGEAVFLDAGGLHCYLQGTGVELLANSDNVVRAGLTAKHVDVEELLAILDPAVEVPVLEPVALGPGLSHYLTPAPEFDLVRCTVQDAVTLPGDGGPRLLLVLDGQVTLTDEAGDELALVRGESAYAPATDRGLTLTGRGDVVVAMHRA